MDRRDRPALPRNRAASALASRSAEDEAHRAAEGLLRPVSEALEGGAFIVMPTGPTAAPSFAMMQDPALWKSEAVRQQLLGLTAMAPILGCRKSTFPCPMKTASPRLSVMGPRGSDLALLGLARAGRQNCPRSARLDRQACPVMKLFSSEQAQIIACTISSASATRRMGTRLETLVKASSLGMPSAHHHP